jgi:hypothetical protein
MSLTTQRKILILNFLLCQVSSKINNSLSVSQHPVTYPPPTLTSANNSTAILDPPSTLHPATSTQHTTGKYCMAFPCTMYTPPFPIISTSTDTAERASALVHGSLCVTDNSSYIVVRTPHNPHFLFFLLLFDFYSFLLSSKPSLVCSDYNQSPITSATSNEPTNILLQKINGGCYS